MKKEDFYYYQNECGEKSYDDQNCGILDEPCEEVEMGRCPLLDLFEEHIIKKNLKFF